MKSGFINDTMGFKGHLTSFMLKIKTVLLYIDETNIIFATSLLKY